MHALLLQCLTFWEGWGILNRIDKLHAEAMEAAFLSGMARKKGDGPKADMLINKAFLLESQAVSALNTVEPRQPTWSVMHRSAGWLALQCGALAKGYNFVEQGLNYDPPEPIKTELYDLKRYLQETEREGFGVC